MSFHYEKVAESKQQAIADIHAAASIPEPLKHYAVQALGALAESANGYFVHIHGHLHNGANHPTSTASIEVRPR